MTTDPYEPEHRADDLPPVVEDYETADEPDTAPVETVEGPVEGVLVDGPPTQVRKPWRATVRTVFAALIALAAMLPLLVEASGLDETSAAVAGALAIAGAITRIMAIPQVNEFLERFLPFLGATGRTDA